MKLAFSTLGVPGMPMSDVAALAVATGFQGVELRAHPEEPVHPGIGAKERAEVVATFAAAGVEILTVAGYTKVAAPGDDAPVLEEIRGLLELARDLGAPFVRVFPGADAPAAEATAAEATAAETTASEGTSSEAATTEGMRGEGERPGGAAGASTTAAATTAAATTAAATTAGGPTAHTPFAGGLAATHPAPGAPADGQDAGSAPSADLPAADPQDGDARAARRLGAVAEIAADHGVRILLETHDSHRTGLDAARVVGAVGHRSVGALWDVMHTWLGGESPITSYGLLAPYLGYVQFKDIASANDTTPLALGAGALPLGECLSLLGPNDWVCWEYEKRWYPQAAELPGLLAAGREHLDRLASA
ncbi:sugar phosphate isomerase/epimerase family protein [Streptomyces sp. NPDC091272]|uniref:sugar phosphate isomerase/epimerase family protein n=1 Tax=Streptomyces sp. NPDC091272 TaxID=3365981 RepID=UPI00381E0E40